MKTNYKMYHYPSKTYFVTQKCIFLLLQVAIFIKLPFIGLITSMECTGIRFSKTGVFSKVFKAHFSLFNMP